MQIKMQKSQNAFQDLHNKPTLGTVATSRTSSSKVINRGASCSVTLFDMCKIAGRRAIDSERKITIFQNEVQSLKDIASG